MIRIIYFIILVFSSISCWGETKSSTTNSSHKAISIPTASFVPSASAINAVKPSPSGEIPNHDQSNSSMECYQVSSAQTGTVVCALKPPSTYSIAVIALIISSGGLLISGFGFLNTLRKDKIARIRSIEDEYWIRKVISPIALEPLIKKIIETVSNIPEDRTSNGFNKKNL